MRKRLAFALASILTLIGARRAASVSLLYVVTPGPNGTVVIHESFSRAAAPLELPLLPDPYLALHRWVEDSASAVAGYYGRLPVPSVRVTLEVVDHGKISGGVTHGGARGARIDVNVGPLLSPADLADDWVLTHEFVHTALPRLPEESTWLDEGLATYVEPIARVRAGRLPPEKVWNWLTWGLPQGLPKAGDQGLDRTHTWGRTYWGGAVFCFLADLELRQKTRNRISLREALIGILIAGANVNVSWSAAEVLAAGDKATGLTVLTDLHRRMGAAPVDPDLATIFRRLGVNVRTEGAEPRVLYDDDAPLAAIRKLIPTAGVQVPAGAADLRRNQNELPSPSLLTRPIVPPF